MYRRANGDRMNIWEYLSAAPTENTVVMITDTTKVIFHGRLLDLNALTAATAIQGKKGTQ